ncbi:hypothetical protein [Novisyntrophococcus fermenticellae]|uniref:hypothetical protein n=1 Tax=Novisyntrophococcus fermenticellae TaxID=2068655 RepID=UPI001E4A56B7|nr:hypothetical protein [Novisyntrophococcus fermenticellae]
MKILLEEHPEFQNHIDGVMDSLSQSGFASNSSEVNRILLDAIQQLEATERKVLTEPKNNMEDTADTADLNSLRSMEDTVFQIFKEIYSAGLNLPAVKLSQSLY